MSVEARQGLGLPVSAAEWDYFGIRVCKQQAKHKRGQAYTYRIWKQKHLFFGESLFLGPAVSNTSVILQTVSFIS